MDYSSYQIEDFLTDDSFVLFCYDDDKEAVAKWDTILHDNPSLGTKITEARELCLLLSIRVSTAEKAVALNKLKTAIDAGVETTETETDNVISMKRPFTRWMAIAATLLILVGAFGIYKYDAQPTGAALYSAANDDNYRLVGSTDFNHRKRFVLPDGSTVLLNGSSTLKIAKDYNVSTRHLLLTGEAFFSVTKNHEKPFVVITGKTATTALGTSFKVQSYPNEAVASVMLSTGKVKVECTQPNLQVDDVTLIPGEQAALYNGDNAFTQSNFNARNLQNWIDRKLEFSGAHLQEITAKLKELYGVNIIPVNQPAEGVSFTGEFTDKNLTEVLDAIGFTNHFTFKQEGNSVKLIF